MTCTTNNAAIDDLEEFYKYLDDCQLAIDYGEAPPTFAEWKERQIESSPNS